MAHAPRVNSQHQLSQLQQLQGQQMSEASQQMGRALQQMSQQQQAVQDVQQQQQPQQQASPMVVWNGIMELTEVVRILFKNGGINTCTKFLERLVFITCSILQFAAR